MSRFVEYRNYTEMVEMFVKMYFENMFKGKITIDIEYEVETITYSIHVTHTYNGITCNAHTTIACSFTTNDMLDKLKELKICILEKYKLQLAEVQNPLY